MVELRGIKVIADKKAAIENLTLNLQDKGIVVINGKNEDEKSAFLKLVGGNIKKFSGAIVYDGSVYIQKNFAEYTEYVASYISSSSKVQSDISVKSNLGTQISEEVAHEVLKRIGLDDKADEKAEVLSESEKRKLYIGRALANQKKILVLDNIFNGLSKEEYDSLLLLIEDVSRQKLVVISNISDERKLGLNIAEEVDIDKCQIQADNASHKEKSFINKFKSFFKEHKAMHISFSVLLTLLLTATSVFFSIGSFNYSDTVVNSRSSEINNCFLVSDEDTSKVARGTSFYYRKANNLTPLVWQKSNRDQLTETSLSALGAITLGEGAPHGYFYSITAGRDLLLRTDNTIEILFPEYLLQSLNERLGWNESNEMSMLDRFNEKYPDYYQNLFNWDNNNEVDFEFVGVYRSNFNWSYDDYSLLQEVNSLEFMESQPEPNTLVDYYSNAHEYAADFAPQMAESSLFIVAQMPDGLTKADLPYALSAYNKDLYKETLEERTNVFPGYLSSASPYYSLMKPERIIDGETTNNYAFLHSWSAQYLRYVLLAITVATMLSLIVVFNKEDKAENAIDYANGESSQKIALRQMLKTLIAIGIPFLVSIIFGVVISYGVSVALSSNLFCTLTSNPIFLLFDPQWLVLFLIGLFLVVGLSFVVTKLQVKKA